MLTCPPSRINLTASDLASFERRWTARQAARQDAENIRLGHGAARQTKLAFVPAAANAGRQRAQSCSSQATICSTEDDDPTIHSNAASPAQRLELPGAVTWQKSPQSANTRQERASPQKQKPGQAEQTRPPTRPLPPQDFNIYEDPPIVHAFIESRHFQQNPTRRGHELETVRPATPDLRHSRTQVPTINQPQLYPTLDPGAPVFVPRTRFGSTTSTSPDNQVGGVRLDGHTAPIERDQSMANLRVRSSFERNTQHSSRSTEGHSIISDSSLSLVPTDMPQGRRRSRNNDQNAALQRPLLGLDRYPAIRPPSVAFASRRSSGSQRPVVFPHRRSSRQHLVDFERSGRSQESRQQNRSTHLAVPQNNRPRPRSPAASTTSRSTPNLLQPPSAPYAHVRSSSLSSGQAGSQVGEEVVQTRRSRYAANAVSESSGLIDEVLLQRDSPLDRLVQMLSQYPARPRSVGHSFERSPGGRTRPSLLNGDPFNEESSDELQSVMHEIDDAVDHGQPQLMETRMNRTPQTTVDTATTSPGQAARTPHKREPTIEDPVALALALPSPEVPSSSLALRSSPIVRSSPQLPSTPILRSAPSSPVGTSSAAGSRPSATSLTPSTQSLAAAVTPRVTVYNDNQPTTTQPQTPADITRSTRRGNRGRSNTTQSTLSNVQPSPQQVPVPATTERHPHRHTFPSTSTFPQEVTVGTTPIRVTAVVEPVPAIRRDSLVARSNQRSSGSSENDIEGNLEGLEQDRRVWMGRQEDGTLDVTPPREGRWERYLS